LCHFSVKRTFLPIKNIIDKLRQQLGQFRQAITHSLHVIWVQGRSFALYPVPHSHYTRWGLYPQAVMILACLFCFQWWPLIPTVAIGFLGVVAVIMTVRADHFSHGERVVYVMIAFALFIVEMRAVYKDRDEHDRQQTELRIREDKARREEEEKFSALLKEGHSILGETQEVQTLTKKNLENITGGESFAVVTPQVLTGLVPIPLSIRNFGKYTLTGVTVFVLGSKNFDVNNPRSFYQTPIINVGTLHRGEVRLLQETIDPSEGMASGLIEDGHKVAFYQLYIAAQNFTVEEELRFRKGKQLPWAFKYRVTRRFVTSQTKKKTTFGYKTLAETNWSDGD
jgi:hypothetical protein